MTDLSQFSTPPFQPQSLKTNSPAQQKSQAALYVLHSNQIMKTLHQLLFLEIVGEWMLICIYLYMVYMFLTKYDQTKITEFVEDTPLLSLYNCRTL